MFGFNATAFFDYKTRSSSESYNVRRQIERVMQLVGLKQYISVIPQFR